MANAAPEHTPEQRLLAVIEQTFRRVKVEQGHPPDFADVRDDLVLHLRIEMLLLCLTEAQKSARERGTRIQELMAELALLNFQFFTR